jgi:transcriptional regulator with XRE-family HTH domain
MTVYSPCRIKKERQSRGWTQSRLAGLLGVSKNTISRMERAETVSYELRHRITMLLQSQGGTNGTISKSC